MSLAYYNEYDKSAAAWLRELIKAGHIAAGDVDERSIEDVLPNDLIGYTQCHFFAGIGVWSYALRKAGWPDDRPVWTGSCPCQPFSAAGKGAAFDDERHLWPAFHHLIKERRPDVVFGEQVASKDGLAWIDLVLNDLEGSDYAAGAVDFCSASVGAPHIRQRLYWVADLHSDGRQKGSEGFSALGHGATIESDCGVIGMANAERESDGWRGLHGPREGACENGERPSDQPIGSGIDLRPGPTNGHWRDADWLFCRDGKWRPVELGSFPLVNGAPARVVQLRGFGNAINAVQAQTFVESFMEAAA